MAEDVVIRAEGLGKMYIIGHQAERERYTALRDAIMRGAARATERIRDLVRGLPIVRGDSTEEFWALKSLDFEVRRGEVLGIIGRNGAGKSTLLKVLSRITDPSEGRVTICGRVASLLEVGTGFHPELTGRENVYLNGAILGMTRVEVKRKFDEIVAFADVEEFLDTPVKRYSSGMHVRLAFAVAAHLEPEILVLDEVLAVGDSAFQQRCLGKVKEVSGSGRTVLFVSHNLTAVRSLCERAILLNAGRLEIDADVDRVVSAYLAPIAGDVARAEWVWPDASAAPGSSDVHLKSVRLIGQKSAGSTFRPDEEIEVNIEYVQKKQLAGMRFVLRLVTAGGEIAFGTTDQNYRRASGDQPGTYRTSCTIPAHLLNRTGYFLRINAGIPGQMMLVTPIELGPFFVDGIGNEGSTFGYAPWAGAVCPKIEWSVQPADA